MKKQIFALLVLVSTNCMAQKNTSGITPQTVNKSQILLLEELKRININTEPEMAIAIYDQLCKENVFEPTYKSLQYNEQLKNNKKERLYGLAISKRPDTITLDQIYLKRQTILNIKDSVIRQRELEKFDNSGVYGNNRLFVSKAWNDNYGLYLNDDNGKVTSKYPQ